VPIYFETIIFAKEKNMKKLLFFLLAWSVCAGVATASYSYSVKGKVYYSGSGLVVPKGTPVTHTANFTGGGSVQNTVYTALDGSFSISLSLGTTNPVGANMTLKAVTGICSGSTPWVCNGSSENKDVWVFCNVQINPNLSITTMPALFTSPGMQLPVTTAAFLDQPGSPVMVQNFQVKLVWNPAQMNVMNIQTSSPSQFEVLSWSSVPGSGEAYVSGRAMGAPVPLHLMPESFFDIFFDVILPPESMPAIATVTVVPMVTQLSSGMGEYYYPYQHQSDYFLGTPEKCQATFLIDSAQEWQAALSSKWPQASISPILESEWERHMAVWTDPESIKEGLPYPTNQFLPAKLYVYGGGGGGGYNPEDAGLVMMWGDQTTPAGSYSSAWTWDYGLDPDLRNSTITVTVSPPQMGATGQINAVSFAINDVAGLRRQWWWNVGNPPAPIPWFPPAPTVVTINTAIQGVAATNPVATGYVSAPGFNLANAQSFDVDENFQWIFAPGAIPPPGQQNPMGMWNYWHNLIVTKNPGQGGNAVNSKWYIKWSQPPVVIDANHNPPLINGWDEASFYYGTPTMADDWKCKDERPVTDIHWWGSFIGWTQPYPPPVVPQAYHIGIWTDVPAGGPTTFSHPGKLIWQNVCTSSVWNFAGYDVDPFNRPERKNESCFQFAQFLSENQWFHQEPQDPEHPDPNGRVYWLSISAIYPQGSLIQYPFGWKTRPHFFQDDASSITALADGSWPPNTLGAVWAQGTPLKGPTGETWDLAFELTTNAPEPGKPPSADLNKDGIVNFVDFAFFANQWLTAGP
jgi:hypothetical protein